MFQTAWVSNPRYISMCGGTRSGKTYSILQTIILSVLNTLRKGDKPRVISIVSETFPHLRKGAIRDFIEIMKNEGLWNESKWNKTESTYTFDGGTIMEFFSADNADKVHGSARDDLFINESQYIPKEIARQLFVRTRKRIICDYNPTNYFWLNKEYENRDNCITIHSTYKDNTFLTPEQVAEIESNKGDSNWWRVYGEGKVGQLEGLIYDFEQIDNLPEGNFIECYGMDFGFTNDPTALVHIMADTGRKVLYLEEVIYQKRLLNEEIADIMAKNGINRYVPVYADCAEPKSIADISNRGFNVKPCDKNAPVRSDKLKFQIQFIQGWKLMVTKRSLNLINELRNYTWAKDKDNNTLSFPIDQFNHALDAMRYGVYTHLAQNAGYGNYNISVR